MKTVLYKSVETQLRIWPVGTVEIPLGDTVEEMASGYCLIQADGQSYRKCIYSTNHTWWPS